jgi:hypothetical protein
MRGILPECVQALFDIRSEIQKRGGLCDFTSTRAPLMCMARGVLMFTGAFHQEVTHFLSLDDDLVVSGADVCRLVEADFDVCGIAYRIKYTDRRIQFVALFSPEQIEQEPVRGTLAMQRIGGGLIMYKRTALEKLRDAYGIFKWGGIHGLNTPIEYTDEEGVFLTEDYATCDRWRRLGGEVRLLLDANSIHVSSSGEHYAGNYKDIWAVRHKLLPSEVGSYTVLVGQQAPDAEMSAASAAPTPPPVIARMGNPPLDTTEIAMREALGIDARGAALPTASSPD